ncbi:Rha family transcriptional regulator [Pseudomonas sp. F1002]|uniref:Rha family transcriptional regulator n=1 Tax=Pseudomonas sp. F1002 TaxID=2738821 RepID=UPI00210B6513|nr:Rha family transcriptional regulator [Pseudomonas sp. F1002]
MNTNTVVDMRKFVEARNGEAFTTTQNVADAFGRLHKDVLRSVESLDCSADFTERNFTLSEYIDGSGRRLPQWIMTKDGFMFLVMGFTGKKAAAIKEGYIGAFNWMAEQLGLSSKSLVAKAVSEALGAEGARTLSNVMRCRVAKLDAEHQRSATAKLASALHARFDVPRMELIPADQMDAACNFIASYAIEGEYLPKGGNQSVDIPIELSETQRYLVFTDGSGKRQVQPVPFDACVMSPTQFLTAITGSNGLRVPPSALFDFALAAMEKVKWRVAA